MKRSLRFAVLPLFLALLPGTSRAHPGTGIVVDRDGRIYFTDLIRIWKLEPNGRLSVAVPNKHSHLLYLDHRQDLWGEHLTYESGRELWWSSVWKLARSGAFTEVVPPMQGFPKIFSPVVDREGNRYFAEVNNNRRETSRIVRKTPEGRIELLAGGAWGYADGRGAAARFGSIGGMNVGPDDNIYLTDGPSVRKVSRDGTVSTIARGGRLLKPSLFGRAFGGRSNPLMGLAVDPQGNVFVANHGNQRVLKIASGGRVTTLAKTERPWSPAGVAVSRHGVVVLEYEAPAPLTSWQGHVRVRRISPDGKAHTLAVTGQRR